MRQMLRAVGLLGALVLMALLAACGGHSASPTAPSSSAVTPAPAPLPPAAPGTGATISGTVASQSGSAASVLVGVQNTSVSAPADASGNFTLSNVPATNVVLTFTSAGIQATVPIGAVAANDNIQVSVTVSGSTATLDSQQHTTPANTVQADGTVDNIDVTARSFTLNGTQVVVNSDATITRGGQTVGFTALQRGDRVHVVGVKDGSTIRASEVDASASSTTPPPAPVPSPTPTPSPTPPPPPPPPPAPAVPDTTVNGALSALGGVCPSISLTVGGTLVKTSAATVFTGKNCVDLKNGDTVSAIGPKQSDGSLLASKIYYIAPTPPAVTVSGSISGLSGSCPTFAFSVNGTAVKTTSSTTFSGSKGCTALATGDAVTVTGQQQSSDGSVVAASVVYTGPNPGTDTYVNGAIAGLSGTCPSLTMTVGGTAVHTNASTTFNVKACADLKNGDTIYAAGPKQSDGSVLATRTYYAAPQTTTVSGTISGLSGTCPSVSFNVTSTLVVKTSSSTSFSGVGCTVMANGYAVTVVGASQSDGSLLATSVEAAPPVSTPPPAPSASNTGFVSAISGTCPALTLTINGLSVKTSSSTSFTGKGCTELKVGDYVSANGTHASDGSLSAATVAYSTATSGLYANGTVSSVTGTCPALVIVVSGVTVKTNSATTFTNLTCADVKVGLALYTSNTRQGDGSLLANYVVPAK